MIFFVIDACAPDDCVFIQQFYEKYRNALYKESKKFLDSPDDVDEIVQDTIVKLIEKVDVLREMSPGRRVYYALAVVRNLSINLLVHQKRFQFCSLDDISDILPADDNISAHIQRNEYINELRKVWLTIDAESRTLLERKYILHHSDIEIAKDLHIRPESVRMKLTRTKRAVAKILCENGIAISYD